MKKVALVFVVAVLVPSLVLAWLAVRSLRDQQFLVERQQSLLDQQAADSLAQDIAGYLAQQQQEFSAQVESLAAASDAQTLAAQFDDRLRLSWPLAEVGFCVTAAGKILSPLPNARPAAQMFRLDNSGFLGNREPVEVYLTANNYNNVNNATAAGGSPSGFGRGQAGQQSSLGANNSYPGSSWQSSPSSVQPSTVQQVPPALAGSGGGGGGGGSAYHGNRNGAVPEGAAQNNSRVNSYGRNSSANGGYNSSRGQANQMSFALNSAPASQQMQTKSDGVRGSSNASEPSQAFGIVGQNADNFTRNPISSVDTAANTALADSAVPVPEQRRQEQGAAKELDAPRPLVTDEKSQPDVALNDSVAQKDLPSQPQFQNQSPLNYKAAQSRKVSPQSKASQSFETSKTEATAAEENQDNLSKVVPAEAEFRQLIGDQTDGMLARFLQNKLKLMCWHRLNAEPELIFGAQLSLDRVVNGLRGFVQPGRFRNDEICLAILDDNARPVVLSRANFQANWKRPFVATEIGDALPHWEVAAYLVNPAQLTQAARTAKLTLGLLVVVLLAAIGIGSLLIVGALKTELKLARQKTDFVSNVSHELKTPLTSIRMFSELLAEGRVADVAKQRSYLHIITAEAARLTRLINNVLDFSRMESGEKKYNFQACDLTELVRSTAETFRPHLEASGFQFVCDLPAVPVPVRGDADALSQIIVNLLSNAEKYSTGSAGILPAGSESQTRREDAGGPGKEISLQLAPKQSPLPHVEIKVLDRGPGVPRGSEEKIFEKFYRAHDSLSSGIQGSGLGLTIARQIARAHGGDVVYEAREGGGSCFILRLPVVLSTNKHE